MFLILLTYTAPLAEVDAHLPAHVDWLKLGYADGILLASGRKVPRSGGVVFAQGDRATIESFAATNPFVTQGVATFEIVEVALGMVAPGLEALKT